MGPQVEMQELSVEECLNLMRWNSSGVGRIAIAGPRPVILPVNYALDGNDVVFRTAEGSHLAAAVAGEFVAFEVDEVHAAWRQGWSVLVRGKAESVTDPGELERLRGLRLRSWAPDARERFVRVRADSVTGRRIVT